MAGDPAVAILGVGDFQRFEPKHDDAVLDVLAESSGLHGVFRRVLFEAFAEAGEEGGAVGGGGFADFGVEGLVGHGWALGRS